MSRGGRGGEGGWGGRWVGSELKRTFLGLFFFLRENEGKGIDFSPSEFFLGEHVSVSKMRRVSRVSVGDLDWTLFSFFAVLLYRPGEVFEHSVKPS